jgi:very-short-patch-repair endonuclease
LDASLQGPEPLFVKNLENVQGDERDVVFISVTYGKGPDGKLLQRFGPLNGIAGPRRLNVLFTRAKRRVVVFASFEPDELVLGDGASQGACVLKEYLEHARGRGHPPEAVGVGQASHGDAEAALALALQQQGLRVSTKVGVKGATLDLAVHDPRDPVSFALGILLDGPAYRSAFSVRDRDRLRPASLAALGWRLHTVWTPDWHRDPREVVRRIVAQVSMQARAEPEHPAQGA